jgi:hypothetical protein
MSDNQHGPRDVSIRNRLFDNGIDPTQMAERRRMLRFSQCLPADRREHSDENARNWQPATI